MTEIRSHLFVRRRIGPAGRLALLALVLLPAAAAGGRVLAGDRGALAAALVFAAAAVAAVSAMRAAYPHDRAGAGNAVTLMRAALVAMLAGALVQPQPGPGWLTAAAALLALALDGLDGPLARRAGLQSRFGFWFDMETDALLALMLALLLWRGGAAGAWVLLLGLPHYAFVLAGLRLPWLTAPLPERRRRKAVCVVQLAALVLLASPLVPPPLAAPLAGAVLALVALSFALDILWLFRRRG